MPREIPNNPGGMAVLERTTEFEEPIIAEMSPVHIIGDIGKKYYWSSQARTGMLRGHETVFRFSRPEWTDLPDDPIEKQAARRQLAAFNRDYTKAEQALLNQALEELGSNRIVWQYVSGPAGSNGSATTGFVWYATDSDAVKFVIDDDLSHGGDGQFIKFIPQDTYLKVGDLAYANNDLARKLAFDEMERTGNPIIPEKKAS